MIFEDKTGLLKTFLGSLPGNVAAKLASAVEADRLLDGHVLPHEAILDGLRPSLRGANAERTPTPLRLFCRPFEDLLTSSPRKANHDLFYEFQWMVDELHGGGDATVPRGLDAAIQEGYRLGVRI